MPEEKKDTDNKPEDVVKREDYNKAIEAQNSLKVDKEKAEKELKELKDTKEEETKAKEEEGKKSWEKEKEEKDKIIEDLKKKADDKVSKGVVKESKKEVPSTDAKKMLDEKIPDDDFDPNRIGSNIARYGHYKNPTTKKYTDEQLGMGLDLNRGATSVNPELIPNEARTSNKDIIL